MAKRSTGRARQSSAKKPRAIEVGAGGGTFLIEVDPAPKVVGGAADYEGGSVAGGGAAGKALEKLKDVGQMVGDVCRSIQGEIERALKDAAPQEVTLEFGVKLTGEAGIPMLTKASAEGTLKVTAKWKFA